MEKIDLSEMLKNRTGGRKLLPWLIINATTHKEGSIDRIIEDSPPNELRVKFTVNEVDLPVEESFKDIEERLDRMVKEMAEELVAKRMASFFSEMDDTMYEVYSKLKEYIKEKFGFDIREE